MRLYVYQIKQASSQIITPEKKCLWSLRLWQHLILYSGVQRRGRGNQGGLAWGMWSYQTVLGDGLGWFEHTKGNGGISWGNPEQTSWCDIWCLQVLWSHWKFRVACYRQHLCRSGVSGEVHIKSSVTPLFNAQLCNSCLSSVLKDLPLWFFYIVCQLPLSNFSTSCLYYHLYREIKTLIISDVGVSVIYVTLLYYYHCFSCFMRWWLKK